MLSPLKLLKTLEREMANRDISTWIYGGKQRTVLARNSHSHPLTFQFHKPQKNSHSHTLTFKFQQHSPFLSSVSRHMYIGQNWRSWGHSYQCITIPKIWMKPDPKLFQIPNFYDIKSNTFLYVYNTWWSHATVISLWQKKIYTSKAMSRSLLTPISI